MVVVHDVGAVVVPYLLVPAPTWRPVLRPASEMPQVTLMAADDRPLQSPAEVLEAGFF